MSHKRHSSYKIPVSMLEPDDDWDHHPLPRSSKGPGNRDAPTTQSSPTSSTTSSVPSEVKVRIREALASLEPKHTPVVTPYHVNVEPDFFFGSGTYHATARSRETHADIDEDDEQKPYIDDLLASYPASLTGPEPDSAMHTSTSFLSGSTLVSSQDLEVPDNFFTDSRTPSPVPPPQSVSRSAAVQQHDLETSHSACESVDEEPGHHDGTGADTDDEKGDEEDYGTDDASSSCESIKSDFTGDEDDAEKEHGSQQAEFDSVNSGYEDLSDFEVDPIYLPVVRPLWEEDAAAADPAPSVPPAGISAQHTRWTTPEPELEPEAEPGPEVELLWRDPLDYSWPDEIPKPDSSLNIPGHGLPVPAESSSVSDPLRCASRTAVKGSRPATPSDPDATRLSTGPRFSLPAVDFSDLAETFEQLANEPGEPLDLEASQSLYDPLDPWPAADEPCAEASPPPSPSISVPPLECNHPVPPHHSTSRPSGPSQQDEDDISAPVETFSPASAESSLAPFTLPAPEAIDLPHTSSQVLGKRSAEDLDDGDDATPVVDTPVKQRRRGPAGQYLGVFALGAAFGAVGTIAGLMQLVPQ